MEEKLYIKMVGEPLKLRLELKDYLIARGIKLYPDSQVFKSDVRGNTHLAKSSGNSEGWCGHGGPPRAVGHREISISEYMGISPLSAIYA